MCSRTVRDRRGRYLASEGGTTKCPSWMVRWYECGLIRVRQIIELLGGYFIIRVGTYRRCRVVIRRALHLEGGPRGNRERISGWRGGSQLGGGGLFFCFCGAGDFPSSAGFSLGFAGELPGLSLFCGRNALALSRMVMVSRSPK